MSVFENVIASFNEDLIKNSFEKKLNEICTIIDKNLVVHKDTNGKLSVQGPLSSLTILETKLKSFLKSEPKYASNVPFYQSRKISGTEAQIIGLLNTKEGRKTVDRDENLLFLNCEHCSYKTKRPSHLEKHLKKHSTLQ